MSQQRQHIGMVGENVAQYYLRQRGYRLCEVRFRLHFGEVDIIARKGSVLHFVEVKTRTYSEEFFCRLRSDWPSLHSDFRAEYSITPQKQRNIRRVALYYLQRTHTMNMDCSFDVIVIQSSPQLQRFLVSYYANAFS